VLNNDSGRSKCVLPPRKLNGRQQKLLKKTNYKTGNKDDRKRVKINACQYGLLFKNGVYKKLLTEGKYWIFGYKNVLVYDITRPFAAPVELSILLQDEAFANVLQVIEVRDGTQSQL